MLHELLLALSGHPSPLFSDATLSAFPAITPAERSLIQTTGHLATTHRALKKYLAKIVADHPSLICRAVAQSIVREHLSRFQQLILEKEREILRRDAGTVGAYDIVPLAGVLKSFEGWKRRLEWYWDLACLMLPPLPRPTPEDTSLPRSKTSSTAPPCTGALLLKSLRLSANTGYPDIAAAAVELQAVAERVWLRHLSSWILTGQLSPLGELDFFVKRAEMHLAGVHEFTVDQLLVPPFATDSTVDSILFIGKLRDFLKSQRTNRLGAPSQISPKKNRDWRGEDTGSLFNVEHTRLLTSLETPIRAAVLEPTINDIRRSISNLLVDELLPTYELMQILKTMKDYFLLGNLGFTDNLIIQAEKHLNARHQQLNSTAARTRGNTDLAGVLMKQGELDAVLSKTWTATAQAMQNRDDHDDELDWAQDHVRCKIVSNITDGQGALDDNARSFNLSTASTFSDLLLSAPAMLTIELESSLGFFLPSSHIRTYSVIHAYLIAIRRGQHRIEMLRNQSTLRKRKPASRQHIKSRDGGIPSNVRDEGSAGMVFMRRIWACSSDAYFVLSELGAYLTNEVVGNSWKTFQDWAAGTPEQSKTTSRTAAGETPLNMSTSSQLLVLQRSLGPTQPLDGAIAERIQLRDIEDLTKAHQQYLSAVSTAMMLQDEVYTRTLRTVLGLIDQLVAFVERLQQAHSSLNLHRQGNDNALLNRLVKEEKYLQTETLNTSEKLREGLDRVKDCLSELATARTWSTRGFHSGDRTAFEPWESGAGIERLLTKLNFSMDMGD